MLNRAYGFADFENRVPADGETHALPARLDLENVHLDRADGNSSSRAASSLDDDVNDHIDFEIPAFQGQPITLLDLYRHNARHERCGRFHHHG